MILRNHWMIDRARYVLAVYDGGYRSGTAATVRYAQKKGRKMMNIHPATFTVTYEPDDWSSQLHAHI